MKDWQPTPILEMIPVGGRLFGWWDRGVEILCRFGIACPKGGKSRFFVLICWAALSFSLPEGKEAMGPASFDKLCVRDATAEDLTALTQVKKPEALHRDRFRAAQSPTFRSLVLEQAGNVIGFVS